MLGIVENRKREEEREVFPIEEVCHQGLEVHYCLFEYFSSSILLVFVNPVSLLFCFNDNRKMLKYDGCFFSLSRVIGAQPVQSFTNEFTLTLI